MTRVLALESMAWSWVSYSAKTFVLLACILVLRSTRSSSSLIWLVKHFSSEAFSAMA